MRFYSLLIPVFLCSSLAAWTQNGVPATTGEPVFTADATSFDFGLINEEDHYAEHIFIITNTGNAPLIISHVQSSCGCTEPDWTREPIAPGKTGEVVITYSAQNRPGPFQKTLTVYTNEKQRRQRLTISGDVVPKASSLATILRDTVGSVAMERKSFEFNMINPTATPTIIVWIKNFGNEDMALSIADIPPYVTVEAPKELKSGQAERLKVTFNTPAVNMKGHTMDRLAWQTVSASGNSFVSSIPVSANVIDDFAAMTPEERDNTGSVKLGETVIDFGKIKKSRGFLGLASKKDVTRQTAVSNTGKSQLTIHSVSCDDPRVSVGIAKKTLQPGETTMLTVSVKPNNIDSDFFADIIIVSNDFQGPVREIRVLAEKSK